MVANSFTRFTAQKPMTASWEARKRMEIIVGLADSRQGCHKRQFEQEGIGKGQEAYLQSLSSLGL